MRAFVVPFGLAGMVVVHALIPLAVHVAAHRPGRPVR